MFQIVNLRNNKYWPDEKGETIKIFDNGKTAQASAKYLNNMCKTDHSYQLYTPSCDTGVHDLEANILTNWFGDMGDLTINRNDKWQVRKVNEEKNWRECEIEKFASNKYKMVPWAEDEHWVRWSSQAPQCDHFVHCSTQDENALAYIKNEEAGIYGLPTRISPAKYFEKFIKDKEYEEHVCRWLTIWMKVKSNISLNIATTREDIRRIYENGPGSCMSGCPSRFFKGKGAPHPAEAYAGGDLGVAYLSRGPGGKISARSVVWPQKKIFTRIYGSDASLLSQLLRADGYTIANSFDGAKLLPIPISRYTKNDNSFLMPYLDGDSYYLTYNEVKRAIIMSNKHNSLSVNGQIQEGFVVFPFSYVSDLSGKKYASGKDAPKQVYLSMKKSQRWSTSEADKFAYICCLSNKVYSRKDCPPIIVVSPNGGLKEVAPFSIKSKNVTVCGFLGLHVLVSDTEDVVVGYEPNGDIITEKWSIPARDSYSFRENNTTLRSAVWLKSLLPGGFARSARYEHLGHFYGYNSITVTKATYPERVTRENAHKMLRRVTVGKDGKMSLIQGEDNSVILSSSPFIQETPRPASWIEPEM